MNAGLQQIALFLTPAHDCHYLPDRQARTAFVDPAVPLDAYRYQQLLDLGFRRSGEHVYRPHCEGCNACQSTRLPVEHFQPRRSQRRIQRLNQGDIQIDEQPCGFSQEHYDLYKTYTAGRHADGEMAGMNEDQYMGFVRSSWCDTVMLEFRLQDRLVAVAVTDVIPDGLSAVYTFFDPALSRRSLGVLAILSQIEHARQQSRSWLYLGYWIAGSPKMAYKTDYQPLQLFRDGCWIAHAAG